MLKIKTKDYKNHITQPSKPGYFFEAAQIERKVTENEERA
jgi:hypothetical protein